MMSHMCTSQPARRPSTRDLQNSPDMKHWKKEQDRQRVKAEQDRIAAELEKKYVVARVMFPHQDLASGTDLNAWV
jgi:hypothetical protein